MYFFFLFKYFVKRLSVRDRNNILYVRSYVYTDNQVAFSTHQDFNNIIMYTVYFWAAHFSPGDGIRSKGVVTTLTGSRSVIFIHNNIMHVVFIGQTFSGGIALEREVFYTTYVAAYRLTRIRTECDE